MILAAGVIAHVLPWVLAAVLDFIMSLAAFAVWTHFDLDGWWQQRHIAKGRRLDRAARDELPPIRPGEQRWRITDENGLCLCARNGWSCYACSSERVFDATVGFGAL